MSPHTATSNSSKTINVLRSIFQIFLRGLLLQVAKLRITREGANSIPITVDFTGIQGFCAENPESPNFYQILSCF
jgi:hypothetical protein